MNKYVLYSIWGITASATAYVINNILLPKYREQKKQKEYEEFIGKTTDAIQNNDMDALNKVLSEQWNKQIPNPNDKILFTAKNTDGTTCWVAPCNMNVF